MNLETYNPADGVILLGLPGSEFIIDEIWKDNCYSDGFDFTSDSVVVDVGANQGYFSIYAAQRCKKVIAIEPDLTNYEILKKNIEANQLQNVIIPLNLALGSAVGILKMYRPKVDGLAASGMISSKPEYLSSIGIDSVEIDSFDIPVVTFDSIIANYCISTDQVFVKIDCEGAELEILKGMSAVSLTQICAITMETHECYSDKDVFYSILDKGMHVVAFSPMKSIYKIGALTAVNFHSDRRITSPVIVVEIPDHCNYFDAIICVDASKSFSTISSSSVLVFDWTVNGVSLNTSMPVESISVKHLSVGENIICLKITDDSGAVSEHCSSIYRLPEDYPSSLHGARLLDSSLTETVKFSGSERFFLDSTLYPSKWRPEKLVLQVVFPKIEDSGCIIHYFNREIRVPIGNAEIVELDFIQVESGLFFDIITTPGAPYSIKWWFAKQSIRMPDSIPGNLQFVEGRFLLADKSVKYQISTLPDAIYEVSSRALKVDWIPQKAVIAVCTRKVGDEYLTIKGNLLLGGKQYPLDKWYTEVNVENFQNGFTFKLELDQMLAIDLVWWLS